MSREKYVFRREWLDYMAELESNEKMAVREAIDAYALDGTEPIGLSRVCRIVFSCIKTSIDNMAKEYDDQAERSRENGKKGGRPRKPTETHQNPENPVGYLGFSEKPTETQKTQAMQYNARQCNEISLSAHTREEAACPAEKEKEIFEIFFWRNIPDPGGETARFMGYYGGRKGYNGTRLLDAARSWNPQSPPPRCSPVFLTMWRVLYEKLKPDRPELAAEMLHEGCRVSVSNGSVTIHAPTAVRRLIETERPPEVTEWAKGAPVRTSWP